MSSYKIYLTKSSEVAKLIAHARNGDLKTDDILSICHGPLTNDERIPAIYHDKGYFYCIVELKDGYSEGPTYELTIC